MSKWVQLRQAQLAKETAKNTAEMLKLQQDQAGVRERRWIDEVNAEREASTAEREAREAARAVEAWKATPEAKAWAAAAVGGTYPPPPESDQSARVVVLEQQVAALEARVQWCIVQIQGAPPSV